MPTTQIQASRKLWCDIGLCLKTIVCGLLEMVVLLMLGKINGIIQMFVSGILIYIDMNRDLQEATVSDLVDSGGGDWNWKVLDEWLPS